MSSHPLVATADNCICSQCRCVHGYRPPARVASTMKNAPASAATLAKRLTSTTVPVKYCTMLTDIAQVCSSTASIRVSSSRIRDDHRRSERQHSKLPACGEVNITAGVNSGRVCFSMPQYGRSDWLSKSHFHSRPTAALAVIMALALLAIIRFALHRENPARTRENIHNDS